MFLNTDLILFSLNVGRNVMITDIPFLNPPSTSSLSFELMYWTLSSMLLPLLEGEGTCCVYVHKAL